jgi:hypothetical protein
MKLCEAHKLSNITFLKLMRQPRCLKPATHKRYSFGEDQLVPVCEEHAEMDEYIQRKGTARDEDRTIDKEQFFEEIQKHFAYGND